MVPRRRTSANRPSCSTITCGGRGLPLYVDPSTEPYAPTSRIATKSPRSDLQNPWYLTAIDWRTGRTVFSQLAGEDLGFNNNYAPVTLGPDGAAYVGVLGGLVRLADASPTAVPAADPKLRLNVRRFRDHRLVGAVRQVAIAAIDIAERRRLHDQQLDARHRLRGFRHLNVSYQLPQPLCQLCQPLRQLFQLFHGPPPP